MAGLVRLRNFNDGKSALEFYNTNNLEKTDQAGPSFQFGYEPGTGKDLLNNKEHDIGSFSLKEEIFLRKIMNWRRFLMLINMVMSLSLVMLSTMENIH